MRPRTNVRTPSPANPQSMRKQIRANFEDQLRLSQEPHFDFYSGSSEPLITSSEATVLSISHSYRNAAYHRDTHNPAVVLALAKVMLKAVCAVFVRAHSGGPYYLLPPGEELDSREDAEAVARRLLAGLEVQLDELGRLLANDLMSRLEQVEEWIEYLPLTDEALEAGLADAEFFDKHRSDDQLIALDEEWSPMFRAARHQPLPTSEELNQAREKIQARIDELRKSAGPPTVTLGQLVNVREAARVIEVADDLPSALSVYLEADRALSVLEEYIADAVDAYDRHVDMQMDIERGK